ncbi:cyclic nucleotide-binding domain-containing protein [Brevibacillus sp. MS2.2]|uniref:cyclic nucleotide-binding domain-containing protein n=1 Tax=Brevibacillus sp. MS2.2 TaxID=2738981 RepID=UPI00156BC63F|nr:cyclic nucleotide-binding domain-containing protein [Brevibacillus sp. MS2.2]NRR23980.1 cyclic nucleotide-binding domain-containing protein [Brevibacillus sp. MS2.2]
MKELHDRTLLHTLVQNSPLPDIFDAATLHEMRLYLAEKGDILCSKGDQLHHMHFILEGKIKIFTTLPNGKSLLLRFNNPLAIIGDVEYVTQCEVRNTVEFVHRSLVVSLPFKVLQENYQNHPPFLQFILHKISHKLYTSSNSTSLNLLYPVENRFASYLLSTLSSDTGSTASEELKTAKLTEVAELLGTSYRHLNRLIRNLCAASVIERKKSALIIKDREKISALASGNIYE